MKRKTVDEVKKMTGLTGLVLQGCVGNPDEWAAGINQILTEAGILLGGDTFKDVYVFKHEGNTNVLFNTEGVKLDIAVLAIWRLKTYDTFGGTWLWDYLSNRLGVDVDGPEDDSINNAPNKPIRIYIENVHDSRIADFAIPLPAAHEDFQPFFDGAEISGWRDIKILEVNSTVDGLAESLSGIIKRTMSKDTLDELNYLAARIDGMHPSETEAFTAIIESGRYNSSIAEIINLTFTDNLNRFNLQPVFNEAGYGDFLINMWLSDQHAEAFNRLNDSENPEDRALAAHIEKLEKYTDYAAFARTVIEEEHGVFTKIGYLTGGDGITEMYHGARDIPAEYRAFAAEAPVMVCDTDLAVLLKEMHALGGEYMLDTEYSLKRLTKEIGTFFIRMDSEMLITPANSIYHRNTIAHEAFTEDEQTPELRTFILSVTERDGGRIIGNIYETDLDFMRDNIRENSFSFTHRDAEMKNGSQRRITIEEWEKMDSDERSRLKSNTDFYDPADEARLAAHLSAICSACWESCRPITVEDFLVSLNASYMARAQNSQPDMLRVNINAARQILAQDAAPVYRLFPNGPKKLFPIDAAKTGIWYSTDCEFAVKRQDLPGIEKWANRAAGEILRQAGRDEHNKTKQAEL